jgi:pimeloyl-ACP methyl ester carboxylesterase
MVILSAVSYYPEPARTFMRNYSLDQLPEEEQKRLWQRHRRGDEQMQELFRHGRAMADQYDDMSFTPPYLATITARTLIIYGDRDPLCPVHIALEMYRAIPRSYLWVVPNGGHVPQLNEPFVKAVSPFLRGDWEQG